jgi:hypothetical protein
MLDNALDPVLIDDYGYNSLRDLLESSGALDDKSKPAFCLSMEALARVRKDIMSSRKVKAAWKVDTSVDPCKKLKNSYEVKQVQDPLYRSIDDGSYEIPTAPDLTKSKLEADGVSDFEVDGEPSALAPNKTTGDESDGSEEAEDDDGADDNDSNADDNVTVL